MGFTPIRLLQLCSMLLLTSIGRASCCIKGGRSSEWGLRVATVFASARTWNHAFARAQYVSIWLDVGSYQLSIVCMCWSRNPPCGLNCCSWAAAIVISVLIV